MAGYKSLTGFDASSQKIVNLADPSTSTDAATKAYVDNSLLGLQWKQPVRVASTATVTISNPGTAVFDTITLAGGDRILLKNQSAPAENGIYTFTASGTAMVRATDNDSVAEMKAATVFVQEGSTNADKAYTQTAEVVTLGTTGVVWAQFGGGQSYTADGNGIELTSTTFSLELDPSGSGLSKGSAGLKVDSTIAGNALTLTSGVLDVVPGTNLEISSDTIRIAASAAGNGLVGGGASVLAVGAGTGILSNANDVAIDTSVTCRRFSQLIGNGSSTSIAVTHSLGTKDITWSLRDAGTDAFVVADVVATSTTVATFTFAVAPASNAYSVTITG